MRVVFLGTSHGAPEQNRKCSCTMIEVGDKRYFIDMGTFPVEEMRTRNIDVKTIKGVFITHMHGDHTNGLVSFVDFCSLYNFFERTVTPVYFLPERAEEVKKIIGDWTKLNGTSKLDMDIDTVKEGVIFEDDAIKVTAYRTKHGKVSFAYLVEAEGKRLFFSGDLSDKGPQDDFPVSVLEKPLDLLVCEGAHFPATSYLPVFENKQENIKRLCFNHYSNRHIISVHEMREKLSPGVPVYVLEDGMEFTL